MTCASLGKSTVQALAKLVSVHELYNIPIFEVLFFITSFQIIPGVVSLACKHFSAERDEEEDASSSSAFLEALLPSQHVRRDNFAAQFKKWILPVAGAFSGACVILFQFAALRNMSLGNASVIFWTCPAIVYVLSIIIGRERITTVKTLCLLMTLFGSLLILKPEVLFHDKEAESSDHVPISRYLFQHAGYALLAAFLQAISFITKRAEQTVGPSSFIIRGIVGSIACVVWTLTEDRNRIVPPFTLLDNSGEYERISGALLPWLAILCAAVLFSASEFAQEEACVNEVVSTVGCVGALEVVFAFVWQVVMFNDVPDWITVTGAACIFISVLVLILRKGAVLLSTAESRRQNGVDNADVIDEEEKEGEQDAFRGGVINEDSDERRPLL